MFLKKKNSINLTVFFLINLSFSIFLFTNWITDFFGDYVGYNEIIFYFKSDLASFKAVPFEIYISFIQNVILKSLIISIVLLIIFNFFFKKNFFISLINKIVKFKNFIQTLIIFTLLLSSISYFTYKFNFNEVIFNNKIKNVNFFKNFNNPYQIKFNTPKQLQNLILIFYESAEINYPNLSITTEINGLSTEYFDPEHVHKSLKILDGYEVENFVQAQSLEWSMAGMVAAQCAIPIYDINRSGILKTYKPLCISDILNRYGYEQYFFTGVEKNFQKQDQFYLNHGFDKVFGRKDFVLKKIKDKFFNSWGKGLNDDVLFEQAFNKIKEINDKERPFNIVIKTSDTHFPYKYSSPNCKSDKKLEKIFKEHFYFNLRKSFKCSSQFIAEFINKLKKEQLYENTLIVISGDHLISTNETTKRYLKIDDYNKDPFINRRIFFKVINSNNSPTRNLMSHYDIGPTILHDLNLLDLNQYKFGLGLSLYSDYDPRLYYDEYVNLIRSQNLSLLFNKYLRINKLNN